MRRCWAYAIVFYVSSTVGAAAAAAAYGVRQSCSTCLDSAATATATATTTTAGFPSTRLPPSQPVSTALAQARRKNKIPKTTSANLMIGGSVVAASVVLFAILNAITTALVKAFVFTFIAKFLVSANWRPSGHGSKENTHGVCNLMIVTE